MAFSLPSTSCLVKFPIYFNNSIASLAVVYFGIINITVKMEESPNVYLQAIFFLFLNLVSRVFNFHTQGRWGIPRSVGVGRSKDSLTLLTFFSQHSHFPLPPSVLPGKVTIQNHNQNNNKAGAQNNEHDQDFIPFFVCGLKQRRKTQIRTNVY